MENLIEEIANAIHINCHKGLTEAEAKMIAKWCYQEIERKASEVARNIFGNLRMLGHIDFDGHFCIRKDCFEELEKKYMEEVNDKRKAD